jgi:NADH dehydrogenase (ubiquinone) 1 alpha/beta subcomplex 1
MQRLRAAVLRRVRLQPSHAVRSLLRARSLHPVNLACFVFPRQALALASPALACSTLRSFAAGTYLDKAQVTDRVLNVVKNFAKVDPAKARRSCEAEPAEPNPKRHHLQVKPSSAFQSELGLDSLDTVEVVMAFEEEFSIEIPDSEADKILAVSDAIEYLAAHPSAK